MITLLLYIPLIALTDGRNHRRRNEYTHFAWAGGTFSPVVLLCQFSVLAGNRFWFYILLMYLGYCTIHHSFWYTRLAWAEGTFFTVVLWCQFSVLAGNRFWFYILLMYLGYRTIQLWCCVSFFGSGGKYFLVLRTYLVYNTFVRLCFFLLWRES